MAAINEMQCIEETLRRFSKRVDGIETLIGECGELALAKNHMDDAAECFKALSDRLSDVDVEIGVEGSVGE